MTGEVSAVSVTRKWLKRIGWIAIAGVVAFIVVHVLVAYHFATWPQVWGWGAPTLVIWGIIEKYAREYRKESDYAKTRREAQQLEVAKALEAEKEATSNERRAVREGVESLTKIVEGMQLQVQALADDNKNNDGSTQRDRNDLMFAETKMLASLIASTTPIAMWWGVTDSKGRTTPTRVSDRFVKLTGMWHEQTRNGGWLNFVALPDQVRVSETARVAMERGIPFQADYTLVNVITEQETRVRHFGEPIKNPITEKIIGWTGEIYELTDPGIHQHRRAGDMPASKAVA